MKTLTIEKARYDRFCADFKNGKYGNQRFGQAFYNEFKLEKTSVNVHHVWNMDGDQAKKYIAEICEFN